MIACADRFVAGLRSRGLMLAGVGTAMLSAFISSAPAANLYWDGDGTGTVGGGSGTWNVTFPTWSTTSTGNTYQAWANAGNDTANFQFTAGTVSVTVPVTVGAINFGSTGYTLSAGGGSLTTSATPLTITTVGANATVAVPITGAIAIAKSGSGSVTLSGTNTYSGGTTVSGGTLRIAGSVPAGAVSVNGLATLGGGGTIGGSVTTQGAAGGRVDPGDFAGTIGSLNVTGNFSWNGSADGSATMLFELDTGGISDRIVVGGTFTKGSGPNFVFDFRGGGAVGTYTLVQATGGHDFAASNLSYTNLGPNLSGAFNTSDATKIRFTVSSDLAPTVSISGPSSTATNSGPVTYTITYVDDNFSNSTLATTDVTLNTTGTATGTVTVTNGSSSTQTVTISSITGDGSIGISIGASTGVDLNGHLAGAAGPSASFAVGNSVPAFTSSNLVNTTYGSPFTYTVTTNVTATLGVSGLPGGLTFDSTTGIISGTPTAAGNTNVTLTATDAFGNVISTTLSIRVAAKPVIVSGLTVVSRSPNGTTLATLNTSNVILAGLVGVELQTVTLNISGATANFADANIGTNKAVTVTGLALAGVGATNYALTNPTLTGTILGQPATVNLTNLNQVYDALPKPVTVTTVPAGLTVVVTYNGSSTVPTAVGTYSVLAIISDATYGGSASGSLGIAALGQTIAFAALPDRSKTDPAFALSASASSGLPVSFTVSGPASLNGTTLTLTGSTGLVTVTANQAGGGNYGAANSVVRTFNVSDRPVPGVYIGSFTGDRSDAGFGLLLRPDNTAVFAGYLPTLGIGLTARNITVDQTGNFSTTFTPLGNTIVVTLRGRIAGNSITGDVAPFVISFSGSNSGPVPSSSNGDSTVAEQPATRSVAAQLQDFTNTIPVPQAALGVGGLYNMLVSGSTGAVSVSVFAGPDGRSYVYSSDGVRAGGAVTSIANDGTMIATLSDQSRVAVTFSSGAAAAGTYTPAGGAAVRIVGGEDGFSSAQRIVNLSVLGRTRPGDETLVSGFSIRGTAPKRVLIRVAGPALVNFPSVSAPLANPSLQLYAGSSPFGFNDDWGNTPSATIAAQMASVSAFPFAVNSRDAALVANLEPGNYSVYALGGDGNVLTEIYELLDTGETPGARRLGNISTRGLVGLGGDPLVAGFYVVGPQPKKVLIRGIGPSLTTFGVTGAVIANPRLTLFRDQTVLKVNDDWFRDPDAAQISTVATATGAFALGAQSLESAILIVLEPGSYSARVENVAGVPAIGMVEIYDVP